MNILLIIAALVLIFNVVSGFKKGMTHQLVSLVSITIGGILILLVGCGLRNYVSGDLLNVFLVIVLLAALAIIRQAMGAFFFSLKIVSKIPIIHGVDRLLGIAFGVVETVILLWILYTLVMMFDLGAVGELIKMYTAESRILLWFYQNNYIAFWFDGFMSDHEWLNFLKK